MNDAAFLFSFPVADVKQDMLETIVPKSEYDSVMVVLGEHKGKVSKVTSLLYIYLFKSD